MQTDIAKIEFFICDVEGNPLTELNSNNADSLNVEEVKKKYSQYSIFVTKFLLGRKLIMIDNLKQNVIAIVKSAISGEGQQLSDDFDIVDVLEIAKKHQIQGLIYYGALNCGIDASLPAMQQMFMILCNTMAISERQMYEISRVFDEFSKNSIDYMPLKGTLLKKMYPKPDMRVMGDADILIKMEDYEKIRPIMLEMNFKEKKESDHELRWVKSGILFELHKRLIPSNNKDYYAYYGDGWRLAVPHEDIPHRFKMTNEDQMIYLFTHFAKHYRDGGIGIRHLTDLYVYRKTNLSLDEEYINAELKKLGLCDFYINIVNTISAWFGNCEFDQKSEIITDVIFGSGAYGQSKKKNIAKTVSASQNTSLVKSAKISRFLKMMFPTISSMELHYAFLKKFPCLLPITWIMRLFKVAFFKTDKARSFYKKIKGISSQDISDYNEALHFVGLDFNFEE